MGNNLTLAAQTIVAFTPHLINRVIQNPTQFEAEQEERERIDSARERQKQTQLQEQVEQPQFRQADRIDNMSD